MTDTLDATFLLRILATDTAELTKLKNAVKKPVNPEGGSLFGGFGLVGLNRGGWVIWVNLLVTLTYSTWIFMTSGFYGRSGDQFFSTASTPKTWSLEKAKITIARFKSGYSKTR